MRTRIWVAIVVAALGFGTSGVATRAALEAGVNPLSLVMWRLVLACIIVAAFALLTQRTIATDTRTWRTGTGLAITNIALPFIFFTFAYEHAGAGFIGLLVALTPIVTALFANFLLADEKLTLPKLSGLAMGFVGIGVLLASGDSGLDAGGDPMLATALSLVAVASISYAGVYARARAGTYDSVQVTVVSFAISVVLLTVATLFFEGLQRDITTWGWTMILYTAVVGTAIPFLLLYWILRHDTATKASLIAYIVPLIAIVAGVTLLDEQIGAGIAVGGLLILVGVVVTDRAERLYSTPRTEG